MYHYHAFKLNIQSDLYFPELLEQEDLSPVEYDLRIHFGDVSLAGLNNPLMTRPFCQANAEALWLHIPEVARFLITNGTQITIQPYSGVDECSIRVFILGSCMGAVLMQRDLFLLHGNAVKVGGAVHFICRPFRRWEIDPIRRFLQARLFYFSRRCLCG